MSILWDDQRKKNDSRDSCSGHYWNVKPFIQGMKLHSCVWSWGIGIIFWWKFHENRAKYDKLLIAVYFNILVGPDKRGYQVRNFLISSWKQHSLQGTLYYLHLFTVENLMSTHNLYFHGEIRKKIFIWIPLLILVLLNLDIPCFANCVDPDQLASEEANWSGSALFAIKYVNI